MVGSVVAVASAQRCVVWVGLGRFGAAGTTVKAWPTLNTVRNNNNDKRSNIQQSTNQHKQYDDNNANNNDTNNDNTNSS